LQLVTTSAGSVAFWLEGGSIFARGLNKEGCPATPAYAVGKGKWLDVDSAGKGAAAAWVDKKDRLVAVRVEPDGKPAGEGLVVTSNLPVLDPPSIATAGKRLAFAWTEAMSEQKNTKRIVLRTLELGCLPGDAKNKDKDEE
jgi:hypothetical protein